MPSDLPLLMALRVQGIAGAERLSDALQVPEEVVRSRVAELIAAGAATERTGRLSGYSLTPDGLTQLDTALADEGLRTNEDLIEAYDRFMLLNKKVLGVSSDWQVRRHGGVEAPNDHTDPSYDDEVIQRLSDLHDRARVLLKKAAECSDRFAPYLGRFDSCVERLRSGDKSAFTAPLAESYHTIWFELHQDFLLTLGLEREE